MPEADFVFPNDVHVAWSIMIVLYPYITGLVAGAFVVSALYHVFRKEVLKPVARLALVTSFCFAATATIPLLLHLHHAERALLVVITPSATSAIAGFGFIYSAYMLVLVLELWLVFRPAMVARANNSSGFSRFFYSVLCLGVREITDGARKIDERLIRALAFIGIPIACVLHGYVGFLFGAVKANPWWSTSLMPVIFLASAVVSGVAGLVVLYLFLSWRRRVPADADCVRALAWYLWSFLILAVALETLELGQIAYEGSGEWPVFRELLTEHLAVSYGVIQVLVGSIAPFFLLMIAILPKAPRRLMIGLTGISSVLVLVQVFAMRWNVVIGGQLFSKSLRGFVQYTLHWTGREGLIAAGIVLLLPFVVLWVVSKIVPLWHDEPVDQSQLEMAS